MRRLLPLILLATLLTGPIAANAAPGCTSGDINGEVTFGAGVQRVYSAGTFCDQARYATFGRLWATFQLDGNFVVYQRLTPTAPVVALWASNTSGRGADRIVFQSNGDIAIYNSTGWIWVNGGAPAGYVPDTFAMQSDGNAVQYAAPAVSTGGISYPGTAVWSTNTWQPVGAVQPPWPMSSVAPAGWRRVLAQDFTTPASPAQFNQVYGGSWCPYADGTNPLYGQSQVSAVDGVQRFTLNGYQGAAGSYGPPATCWGRTYGRFSIRFKVTGAPDSGVAMLLWPTDNHATEGEVDWPEGTFGSQIMMFQHPTNCTTTCGQAAAGFATGESWYFWHTATLEWKPGRINSYLDGDLIGTATTNVPSTPHRFTLQVAPHVVGGAVGTLDVDWVTADGYTP